MLLFYQLVASSSMLLRVSGDNHLKIVCPVLWVLVVVSGIIACKTRFLPGMMFIVITKSLGLVISNYRSRGSEVKGL